MQSFLRVSRNTVLRSLIHANSNNNNNNNSNNANNSTNNTNNNSTTTTLWYNKYNHQHQEDSSSSSSSGTLTLSPISPPTTTTTTTTTTITTTTITSNSSNNGTSSSSNSGSPPLSWGAPSRLLEGYSFNTKYDPSTKKYMLIGLGSEILIELCAEALFFEQIPHAMFSWTLNAVQGTEYLRRRLGRHITRKGNKYGLWVDDEDDSEPTTSGDGAADGDGGIKKKCTTIVAHYMVEGELGSAKIVLQVGRSEVTAEKKLVLLLAEFSTRDKFVIFELDDKPQLPAM